MLILEAFQMIFVLLNTAAALPILLLISNSAFPSLAKYVICSNSFIGCVPTFIGVMFFVVAMYITLVFSLLILSPTLLAASNFDVNRCRSSSFSARSAMSSAKSKSVSRLLPVHFTLLLLSPCASQNPLPAEIKIMIECTPA